MLFSVLQSREQRSEEEQQQESEAVSETRERLRETGDSLNHHGECYVTLID